MHNWFRSYLSGRMQFVKIRESRSTSRPLSCGIPQGSILGPMLYLGDIMREHGIFYHMYADDTQIYMSFRPSLVMLSSVKQESGHACVILTDGCC